MAKDPWHKGRLGKIKNSPAGDMVRKAGRSVMGAVFVPGSCGSFSCNIESEHSHGQTKSGIKTITVPGKTQEHEFTEIQPSRSADLEQGLNDHSNVVDLAAYRQKRRPEGYF